MNEILKLMLDYKIEEATITIRRNATPSGEANSVAARCIFVVDGQNVGASFGLTPAEVYQAKFDLAAVQCGLMVRSIRRILDKQRVGV